MREESRVSLLKVGIVAAAIVLVGVIIALTAYGVVGGWSERPREAAPASEGAEGVPAPDNSITESDGIHELQDEEEESP